ncbi:MAG: hypothetical protein LW710_04205 [Burkholderiales bacterium]|uniref:hypothetical protein n=1 Tax=Limnobacter sp. TaxID=2003368 RepID=UPI0039BC7F1F|nr:hypothetical protein [Burkholderiales bacterium]
MIKKQMERALNQMGLPEDATLSNAQLAQDQTYVKTVNLLQENIVRLNEQLESATQQVFEAVPKTKQNELQTLFKSLTIYQSTLCGTNLMSTEFSRLSIFLSCLKSNVELYISGVSDQSEKLKLQEFSSAIDQLIAKNKILWESFQEQEINNLSIMKVFDSAKQKHLNLTKQLNDGDFRNPDLLLAIAERHDTDAIVAYGLQQMELIFHDYDYLSKEVMGSLQKFQLDDINTLAKELMLSESARAETVPTTIKKRQPAVNSPSAKETNRDVTNKPEKAEDKKIPPRTISQNFHVELGKLADWLAHDIKTLNNSKSDEKRKLGKIIGEQLEEIYAQIDSTNWSTEKAEALTHKTNLEKRLLTLGQLIEDAMAQTSPQASPKASPEVSPLSSHEFSQLSSLTASSQTESTESQVSVAATAIASVKETSISSDKKLPAVLDKQVKAEVIDIQPAAELSPFDQQLQTAIQKLNSARTRMFDAYSKQEAFRQKLLENHQPYSAAWMNINQTDMVLDFISNNIAYSPHTVFVKPYIEHRLPMAEMIRSIQAERFHVHFDERNCQAYLGSASNWLDTLSPHFDYLDKLMSVTESLLANQQRVA